jgi:uncharacterized protein YcbX
MTVSVVSLRRYPVKAMGGEDLDVAAFDARCLSGDRWYAVEDIQGRFASGKDTRRFRRRDRVFDYNASTDSSGRVAVRRGQECWLVGDPELDRHLSEVMDAEVRVAPEAEVPHQDMGAVSLISTATLAWCAATWGGSNDARRVRANVVIAADEPFVEETWLGREISLGSVGLRLVDRAPRCRTIDIAQDGAIPGTKWLRQLAQERDMLLAVYADVIRVGRVSVGDRVEIPSFLI